MTKWEVNYVNENKIILQCYFDKPVEVSASDAKDFIYV